MSLKQSWAQKFTLPLTILFFSGVILLLLTLSLQKELSHDQHQFIASGKLLAHGLIPYRDFPYFHLPYLAFIYAFLFKLTEYNLFAARMFNMICELISVGLVFFVAFKGFKKLGQAQAVLIAMGSALLLLTNPLFIYTAGRAWNHDLPVLLVLLSFIVHCYGLKQSKVIRWMAFSGGLVGLAIGIRLSFPPVIVPFLWMIFYSPLARTVKEKFWMGFYFCVGGFLTLFPAFLMFLFYPKQFWFGSFGYAKLNTIYRQQIGYSESMTLVDKLVYLVRDVLLLPSNFMLIFTLSVLGLSLFLWGKRARYSESFEFVAIILLIPFLLVGSFAPTPSWFQYFYAPVPFVILGIIYGLPLLYSDKKKYKLGCGLFILTVLVSTGSGMGKFSFIKNILSPVKWVPNKVHEVGLEIKKVVGKGKVLTLAPIYPLEGGLGIYKEFSTGVFATRVAHLMPENTKKEIGAVPVKDLEMFFKKNKPKAFLVGFEKKFEQKMITYAKEKGYKSTVLSNGGVLWISPSPKKF